MLSHRSGHDDRGALVVQVGHDNQLAKTGLRRGQRSFVASSMMGRRSRALDALSLRFKAVGRLERVVVVAAAVSVAAIAVVVFASQAPVAWLLLCFTGVVSVAVLVIQLRHLRFFEPLTVVAAVVLVSFFLRALQLFLNADDLLSYYATGDALDDYVWLETSETARFVTQVLREPLEPALTRGIGTVAIFMALVVVGYLLPWGRWLGARVARIGRGGTGEVDLRVVIGACFVIAAMGQALVLVKVGGPVDAANNSMRHTVLRAGLEQHFLIGFGIAGLLIWAAWRLPRSTLGRMAFGIATFEICAFFAVAGSRTRVLLALGMLVIVVHYLWRRWRPREILAGVVIVVVFASGLLSVRQATTDRPVGEALKSAPTYILDPRGVLNDLNEFDYLFEATAVIGSPHDYRAPAPFQYGKGFWQAIHPFVPAAMDPDRPESRDQEFRKILWGDTYGAGRPYTIIGDFWNDFGFPGVIVGSLLFGVLARAMLGLVAPASAGPGRQYRVVLYAMGIVLLYVAVTTTYSVTVSFLLVIALPFLIAMHVIRPATDYLGRQLAGGMRRKAPAR
jgi:hypothetical protein